SRLCQKIFGSVLEPDFVWQFLVHVPKAALLRYSVFQELKTFFLARMLPSPSTVAKIRQADELQPHTLAREEFDEDSGVNRGDWFGSVDADSFAVMSKRQANRGRIGIFRRSFGPDEV